MIHQTVNISTLSTFNGQCLSGCSNPSPAAPEIYSRATRRRLQRRQFTAVQNAVARSADNFQPCNTPSPAATEIYSRATHRRPQRRRFTVVQHAGARSDGNFRGCNMQNYCFIINYKFYLI
jgi:hypothetical protein